MFMAEKTGLGNSEWGIVLAQRGGDTLRQALSDQPRRVLHEILADTLTFLFIKLGVFPKMVLQTFNDALPGLGRQQARLIGVVTAAAFVGIEWRCHTGYDWFRAAEPAFEAFRKIDAFEHRGPGSFGRWLAQIARFKASDALRRESKRGAHAPLEVTAARPRGRLDPGLAVRPARGEPLEAGAEVAEHRAGGARVLLGAALEVHHRDVAVVLSALSIATTEIIPDVNEALQTPAAETLRDVTDTFGFHDVTHAIVESDTRGREAELREVATRIRSSLMDTGLFESVDFSGGIFASMSNTVLGGPVAGAEQFAQASIIFSVPGVEVPADGIVGVLTIDTTGLLAGPFDLLLEGTQIGQDSAFILVGGDELVPFFEIAGGCPCEFDGTPGVTSLDLLEYMVDKDNRAYRIEGDGHPNGRSFAEAAAVLAPVIAGSLATGELQ